jgi:hypothetical protein
VYCRKRRLVTPGTTGWPGRHGDPFAPGACSRELVIALVCAAQVALG